MKFVKLLALVLLLIPKQHKAQCIINIPIDGLIYVNGNYTGTINNQRYYVGSGDSLFMTVPANKIYIDNGGYVEYHQTAGAEIYAASGSTVEFGQGPFFHLFRDTGATVLDPYNLVGIVGIDSVCSPMSFSFQNSSGLDSFHFYTSWSCDGPNFTIVMDYYPINMSMKTDFGDGNIVTTPFQVSTNNMGYASISHSYQTSGYYTIKHVLYNGITPIDSLTITADHVSCCSMPVDIYIDSDNNCIFDAGVDDYAGYPLLIEVDSNLLPIDTLSVTSGFTYTAFGNPGDIYKFKLVNSPEALSSSCPINGEIEQVYQVGSNIPSSLGLSCQGNTDFDLKFNVDSRAAPSRLESHIDLLNPSCVSQNATLTMNFDPAYTSLFANVNPVSQSVGMASWDLANVFVGNTPHLFVQLSGSQYSTGTPVNTTYSVIPLVGDVAPSNNTIVVIDTVAGGWDPNAIYVKPEGCVPVGTNLEYTITFENLGNGVAENIFVLDTLPPGLVASSMRLQFASHNMFVEKIYNGPQVILKFNFPDINLPDSSDHVGRHGSLRYTIDTKNSLSLGASFDHSASIYFDYNDPVLTNTAQTMICWPANIHEITATQSGITIYPNPATEQLTIKTEKQYKSYSITNTIGQIMLQHSLDSKEAKADIRQLAAGIYYLRLEGERGTEVRKFVKM